MITTVVKLEKKHIKKPTLVSFLKLSLFQKLVHKKHCLILATWKQKTQQRVRTKQIGNKNIFIQRNNQRFFSIAPGSIVFIRISNVYYNQISSSSCRKMWAPIFCFTIKSSVSILDSTPLAYELLISRLFVKVEAFIVAMCSITVFLSVYSKTSVYADVVLIPLF